MTNRLTSAICLIGFLTGCAPSLSYVQGRGYYSDEIAKIQLETAARQNRVKYIGKFMTKATGCGNYSRESADRNIVIPALQKILRELGANVADHVEARSDPVDFWYGLLIVPMLMSCIHLDITGEALLVRN